jgi:hypothetical protein
MIVALDPRPCLSRSISQSGQKTRRYRLVYARLLQAVSKRYTVLVIPTHRVA